MKIALVYDAVYPYIKGGGEKRFYEIGKRLARRGHEVHFYGMKLWEGDKVVKKQGMYYHGICKPKSLYEKNRKRSIREAIYFGINSIKLLKEDFDVIDCCGFPYFSLFSCKFVCLLKRKPLYSTWHEVWGLEYWLSYIKKKGILGYIVEKLAVLMPDEIIAVSKHTKNKLINNLKVNKKITVILNGINFNKIQKIKPVKPISDIIFAGRLLGYKNIDTLVKAVKLIKKTRPKIKCLIIGDGPEKNRLEALTKKIGLEKNIKFLGFIENHNNVFSLMKSSKVFVSPSSREGFGIVVIEANACGIPVITTNHKDNAARDLIEEGKNGFVCQLNKEEIAERITKILKKSPGRKMKKACMDLAKKYDWDKIVSGIEEVYLR